MVFLSSFVHAKVVSLRPHAASSVMETGPVLNSDEQLVAVLTMLEECRSALVASGNRDSAHLVSVAALDVRMKLNRIGDAELKLLCEAMANHLAADGPSDATSSQDLRLRPLFRVVK